MVSRALRGEPRPGPLRPRRLRAVRRTAVRAARGGQAGPGPQRCRGAEDMCPELPRGTGGGAVAGRWRGPAPGLGLGDAAPGQAWGAAWERVRSPGSAGVPGGGAFASG